MTIRRAHAFRRMAAALAAVALFAAGCAPRQIELERAPVVSFRVKLEERQPHTAGGPGLVAYGNGSAVKLGPTALLTAGHCLPGAVRRRAGAELEINLELAATKGGWQRHRLPLRFEVAAAGGYDADNIRSNENDDVLVDIATEREDWVLLRLIGGSLPPPYAVLEWDHQAAAGERVLLVTPNSSYTGDARALGVLAVEGETIDAIYVQSGAGASGNDADPVHLFSHGLIGFQLGERSLGGCSGSMLAVRREGQSQSDASAWPMVGLFVASSGDETTRDLGPFRLPIKPLRVAIQMTDELRRAIERELAREGGERGGRSDHGCGEGVAGAAVCGTAAGFGSRRFPSIQSSAPSAPKR